MCCIGIDIENGRHSCRHDMLSWRLHPSSLFWMGISPLCNFFPLRLISWRTPLSVRVQRQRPLKGWVAVLVSPAFRRPRRHSHNLRELHKPDRAMPTC